MLEQRPLTGDSQDGLSMLGLLRKRRGSPLYAILHAHARMFPLVVLLGLAATLFEGLGVGVLIPLLSLFLGQALPAAMPGPIRAIAEFGAQWALFSQLLLLGGLIVALFLAKALVQMANLAFQARLLELLAHTIRCALAGKLLKVGYPFFLEQNSARFVNILYQDVWNLTGWIRSMLSLAASASAVLMIAVLLFWLDWRLSLLVGACAMLMLAAFPLFERRLRASSARAKSASVALDGRLDTVLFSQRTIRLFGQELRESAQYNAASEQFRRGTERMAILRSFAVPGLELSLAVLSVAIIVAGHLLGLSIASVAAYLVLLSRGQAHIRNLGEGRLNTAEISASAREVNWLLGTYETQASRGDGGKAIPDFSEPVRFNSVSYVYPNEGNGLRDASFAIRPGIATALIGASGAGKSTVVNIITRLLSPDTGSVLLGAQPISDYSLKEWRSRVAVAGQDAELVDASVADNIAYGRPDASRADIEEAARLADATGFITGLPAGYETQIGRGGISLSGGQRQRIGLARALLLRPDLLILDEATNAVDGISERAIMELLVNHSHFRTALVISHRESTLAICEDAIVLDDGKVVEAGPIRSSDYFRKMRGSH